MNTQLLDYIKQQLAQGVSKESIYTNLASSGGWNPSDINEAFSVVGINMTNTPSISGAVPTVPLKYAGFWIRFVAFMVDGFILIIPIGVAQFVVGLILVKAELSDTGIKVLTSLVQILITWLYFSLMTHNKGATLGKMLVGITVKSEDFQKLSLGKILLRETIGKFISTIILGIGFIMAGFTQKKQGLHDKFAHSVVVYKDPSKSHRAGLIIGIIIAAFLPALAILGIFSSVVLVSLNVARQKGLDARVVANLSSIRANAELYQIQNGSYSQAQGCFSGIYADSNTQQLISALQDRNVVCYAGGTSYAISAKLHEKDQNHCVDNSGYSGNGIAVMKESEAYCMSLNSGDLVSETSGPKVIAHPSYEYGLPQGWEIVVPNINNNIEAINRENKYALSITAKSLDPELMDASSIVNVLNKDVVKAVIVSQNPSTVVENVEEGILGGEKAFISKFNLVVTSLDSATQAQTIRQALVQYNVFHNGMAYTLVFISTYDQREKATMDFQSIADSFIFK